MKDVIFFFVVLFVGIIFTLSIVDGVIRHSKNDLCVAEYPAQVTGGIIHNSGIHHLTYKGTMKSNGESCEKSIRVTEKEYERRMYQE